MKQKIVSEMGHPIETYGYIFETKKNKLALFNYEPA